MAQQRQQEEPIPQTEPESQQPPGRLYGEMDPILFRRMKAEAVMRGYKGYAQLIEDAVREYLDREETKIA